MPEYHLAYEIDVEADLPEEAVKQATQIVRHWDGVASWDVHDEQGESLGLYDLHPDGSVEQSGK